MKNNKLFRRSGTSGPDWAQTGPLGWALRLAAFLVLAFWFLIRFYVLLLRLLPGMQLRFAAPPAAVAAGAAVWLCVRFRLARRLLFSHGTPRRLPCLAAAAGFLAGWAFDISYDMADTGDMAIALPAFRWLCHGGNGLCFAAVVLALLWAGRALKGLGRVEPRQMLLLFALLNGMTACFVLTSRTVYTWDTAGYWMVARNLAAAPLDYGLLRSVLTSTIDQDYNSILAFPISLVMRVFGGSRAVYLFCISNFYTLPALWGMAALARNKRWGGLVPAGLFPVLIYTGLDGFVDTAAAALAVWAYVVYTSDRPAPQRGTAAGALLVGTFLLRRYYFFFAASFGVAALARKLLFDRKQWTDFLALAASAAVFAFKYTGPFLIEKVLQSDYNDLYSAYDLGLAADVQFFTRYYGLAALVFVLGFALVGLRRKEHRPALAFALIQAVVCDLAFLSVQSHGVQHLLLYLPALALMAVTACSTTAPVLSGILAAASTLLCFFPNIPPKPPESPSQPYLLHAVSFYGETRKDTEQLLALADYVDSLSDGEEKTAAVLASSFLFNSETLSNLRPSLNLPEPEHKTQIYYMGTVDKRDPFNWNIVPCDYLIVADPVQTHLGEENQQVMALLAHDLLEGTGPGAAYQRLPEHFALQNGVTVYIYARTRSWTLEEWLLVSDRLTALYPDYAEKYTVPTWLH